MRLLTGQTFGGDVYQNKMSISATADDAHTTFLQNLRKQASVSFDVGAIGFELIGQSFTETYRFTGDCCQMCTTLHAWEYRRLKLLKEVFTISHYQAAASAT
ncbi:hypothetical protein D3C81_1853360 [compost metagenome]